MRQQAKLENHTFFLFVLLNMFQQFFQENNSYLSKVINHINQLANVIIYITIAVL